MIIPPLLFLLLAVVVVGFIGSLMVRCSGLARRVETLERWQDEFSRVEAAKMKAKSRALRGLE